MKLENKTYDIVGQMGKKTSKATLSEEDAHKLWAMIENPYKNPIGSIVREYTSNCFDSHIEAGVDDAVTVKLGRNSSMGYYISFIDVGVGLSPDRMENVFLKVTKSTKENTDDAIGAFGLGSKSGLSYSPIFYINTHFDGVTYKYQYRKGAVAPELDFKEEYPEKGVRNGSTFTIPIKDEYDVKRFAEACYYQLFYFKNVVFNYAELEQSIDSWDYDAIKEMLSADYKLYEGKSFKKRLNVDGYNPGNHINKIHIANGPVTYPIDENNISIPHGIKDIPVALKFAIGELDIIQTREDVRYTDKTIKAITDKMNAFIDELQELHGKEATLIFKTIKEYEEKFNHPTSIVIGKDQYTYSIASPLLKKKKIRVNAFYKIDKDYELPFSISNSMYDGYKVHKAIKHNDLGVIRTNNEFNYLSFPTDLGNIQFGYTDLHSVVRKCKNHGAMVPLVMVNDPDNMSIKINKQLVVKEFNIPVGSALGIITKSSYKPKLDYYKKILGLSNVHKSKWRDIIVLYQQIKEKYISNLLNHKKVLKYEDIKLDQAWYDAYMKKYRKSSSRDNTKVSYMQRRDTWDNNNATFEQLLKLKGLVIYTEKDRKDELFVVSDNYFISHNSHIKPIALAPSNYKKLQKYVKERGLHNYYTMDEFNDNKDNIKFKTFKDIYIYVTLLKEKEIREFITNFRNTNSNSIFKTIFPEINTLAKQLDDLESQMNRKFSLYDNTFLKQFKDDLEDLEEYVKMKEYSLYKNVERAKEFIYQYGNLLSMSNVGNSYSSAQVQKKDVFRQLALNLTLYKPLIVNSLACDDVLKAPNEEEYKLLSECDCIQGGRVQSEEAILTAMLINMYEIKNKLKTTEWIF